MAHCTPPLGVVLEDKRQKQIKLCWSSSEEREKQSALCDRRQIGLWGKCVPGYFVRRAKVPIIIISGSFINFIFAHNKDKVSQSICHGPISGISRWYLSQFTRSSTSYSFPASNPVLSPLTAYYDCTFPLASLPQTGISELGAPWGHLVVTLQRLAATLSTSSNHNSMELALLAVRNHVNDAILHAQLHGPRVTATVSKQYAKLS